MIKFVTYKKNSTGTIQIEDGAIGFSIEPAAGNDDGFWFTIPGCDAIRMEPGDPGRDFGFISGPLGPEPINISGPINIKFDGNGVTPMALVIVTTYSCPAV